MQELRILAVGAHLDDIEISAGGLLAQAAHNRHTVGMLVMSDSAFTDINGNPSRTRDTALEEGRNASGILGVDHLEVLDFQTDEDIPYNRQSVRAIERHLIKFQPDIVLTHWPHDTHQDHRATALATISAARRSNRILMYEPMAPSGRSYQAFRGQFYFSVNKQAKEIKERALRAHVSQFERYGQEVWINAVSARGIQRGFEIGSEYAECFEVMRWELSLESPNLG